MNPLFLLVEGFRKAPDFQPDGKLDTGRVRIRLIAVAMRGWFPFVTAVKHKTCGTWKRMSHKEKNGKRRGKAIDSFGSRTYYFHSSYPLPVTPFKPLGETVTAPFCLVSSLRASNKMELHLSRIC